MSNPSANTFTDCLIKPGRLRNADNSIGPRIVHMRFSRDVYNDCHMFLTVGGALKMALDLVLKAFIAQVWVGKLYKTRVQ
jgi:hypothetical protein